MRSSIVSLRIWHEDAISIFFLTVFVCLPSYLGLELQFTLAALCIEHLPISLTVSVILFLPHAHNYPHNFLAHVTDYNN